MFPDSLLIYEPRHAERVLNVFFFRNSVFIQFQKNCLFLTACENMVAINLLLPFLELFKVIHPNRHWYKLMTSLDDVNNLINGIVDVIGLWA